MQGRIERPVFHLQRFLRRIADRQTDAMAVLRAPLQRAQDHHVERALQQLDAVLVTILPAHFQVEDSLVHWVLRVYCLGRNPHRLKNRDSPQRQSVVVPTKSGSSP